MKSLRKVVEDLTRKTTYYGRHRANADSIPTNMLRAVIYGWNTQSTKIAKWTFGANRCLPADSEMLAYKDELSERLGREAFLA